MIVSSGLMLLPTNATLDAEHDALFDEDLIGRHPTEAADAEANNVSVSDINEITPDIAPRTEHKKPVRFRQIGRGVIKPLIALIASQYVIVAALVAGVSVTVAHHASHVINEKFAAIATALKRF
ncbi:hypothetical protein V1291_005597 [Nitrobacteraceae bacterium AZCC 1564]